MGLALIGRFRWAYPIGKAYRMDIENWLCIAPVLVGFGFLVVRFYPDTGEWWVKYLKCLGCAMLIIGGVTTAIMVLAIATIKP